VKRTLGSILALMLVAGGLALAGPTEEEKIEAAITAVIDAYRIGDYQAMGQYYAPEVTMVPSDYAPPIQGWTEAAGRYQQMQAQLGRIELIRENTRIVRRGNFAWAVYQWRFGALVGRQNMAALGHTTLVLEKRKGRWLIVHNHSSALAAPSPPPAETPAAKPPS